MNRREYIFLFVMQPIARSGCIGMLSFLVSPDTCRRRADRYAETLASIATLAHHPYKPDSPYMKQTFHALMMTDFMRKISRMRLENASYAATICHDEQKTMLEQINAASHEPNRGEWSLNGVAIHAGEVIVVLSSAGLKWQLYIYLLISWSSISCKLKTPNQQFFSHNLWICYHDSYIWLEH